MKEKLSDRMCHRHSYFIEHAQVSELSCRELTDQVEIWDDVDQLKFHNEDV